MYSIFCEGVDDKEFILQLLKHLDEKGILNSKPEYSKYIETKNGKSYLLNKDGYSTTTKKINSKSINKVLFIFDADFKEDDKKIGGLEKSKEKIENLIKDLNWNIATDYYIFDKNLDDFIINTLGNKENFESCEKCFELKKVNKNRKILTCIYSKLYPKSPYDFSHANFIPLKNKLTQLFN